MSWWDLLKSSENRLWTKISKKIYEESQRNPNMEFRKTIRDLLRFLIREDYHKRDTKDFVDSLMESGNSNLVPLMGLYNIHFARSPHKFLPKKLVDIIPHVTKHRIVFDGFVEDYEDENLMRNFEGFIVVKSQTIGNAYAKDSYYHVWYISNNIVFTIGNFEKNTYRPFFNKFIKGQIILAEVDSPKHKIPIRKIRARGL